MSDKPENSRGRSLAESAKSALLWGGGATLARDLLQFLTMLILVRLLTPEDYGRFAMAQSIIGLIAMFSFGTFVSHSLQERSPDDIDWNRHFSFGLILNIVLFIVTLVVAWGLSVTKKYHQASWPLVGLSLVLIVEIVSGLRHRMLESQHEWKRYRLITLYGAVLGAVAGVSVAFLGGGYWALVVQFPLLGVPAVIDLLWKERWKPRWSLSLTEYQETLRFGMSRMGAGLAVRGRQTVEQGMLASTYDFSGLGIFIRTIGLAMLLAGRFGSIVMLMLYPVVTRIEAGTKRFRDAASKIFGMVCLVTVPAAFFLAANANQVVHVIYGETWMKVANMLPLGVIGVVLSGLAGVLSQLLLANNQVRYCFLIDIAISIFGVALVFWLVPKGMHFYFLGLVVQGLLSLMVSLVILGKTGGIEIFKVWDSLLAPVVGSSVALSVISFVPYLKEMDVAALGSASLIFSLIYVVSLRVMFPGYIKGIVAYAPNSQHIMSWLAL